MPIICLREYKEKFKAEMWDKMQFLFRKYYDRMVHFVAYFSGTINFETLVKVYKCAIVKTPILRSRFVNNPIKPYWIENTDCDVKQAVELIQTGDAEKAVNEFITQEISINDDFQIKVALIRCNGKDILCEIVNHMCMDAADLKEFTAKVFEIYNCFVNDEFADVHIKNGDRSYLQIYKDLSEADKKAAMKLYKNVSKAERKAKFRFYNEGENEKRIIRAEIDETVFDRMKEKCKKTGCTINDLILTSYVRELYDKCLIPENRPVSVPCMVDLRRHLKNRTSEGFSNQVGFMVCTIKRKGKSFDDTLKKVKEETRRKKNDKFLGLYGLPLLAFAYKVFPQFLAESIIKLGYDNPLTGMSDIGVIDESKFNLFGVETQNVWMTGGIKNKPYMQLAVSTFKKRITLSIAENCNKKDAEKLHDTLKNIVSELSSI